MFNGFNGTQNCNHLVCLAKWLSVRLWTKWLWIQIPLQSMKPQISRLFRARRSLTFRKLSLFINKIVLITTSSTFLHLKNAPKYQWQFTIDGCHGYHGFAEYQGVKPVIFSFQFLTARPTKIISYKRHAPPDATVVMYHPSKSPNAYKTFSDEFVLTICQNQLFLRCFSLILRDRIWGLVYGSTLENLLFKILLWYMGQNIQEWTKWNLWKAAFKKSKV